jgi:hypothetical protein
MTFCMAIAEVAQLDLRFTYKSIIEKVKKIKFSLYVYNFDYSYYNSHLL